MYEILKAIAKLNKWVFEYGRADFNNLFDGTEKKNLSYLFLDPVKIKDIDNDSGVTEAKVYSGSFMVLRSSEIDELSYEERFEKYIKPILNADLITIKDSMNCTYKVTFDLWEKVEVINIFDYNFDGIIVTYQISINE